MCVLLVHLFVWFVRVSFYRFSLPLGVGGWLRFVIVAPPGLFYLFWSYTYEHYKWQFPKTVFVLYTENHAEYCHDTIYCININNTCIKQYQMTCRNQEP